MDNSVLIAVKSVQFGDTVSVKNLVESHKVSAQACDSDGCSLLHWAAINNRMAIASLLINNGARVSCPGGVLAEAPLHWAVRRGYARMVDLLIKSGADLSYKSDAGQDALTLACRLGLKEMVFLLLSRGANPDALDNEGRTPFLYCLQNDPSLSIIRLLIQFHADVTVQDEEGNNAFHILLSQGDNIEVIMLNDILMAGGVKKIFAKNRNGHNAFQAAWNKQNALMIRYTWDAMAFALSPTWFQPVTVFLSVVIVPLFFYIFGWMWGAIWLAIIEIFILDKISQPNVFYGNISANYYISVGVAVSLFFSYLVYVHSYVSVLNSVFMMGGAVAIGLAWYLCMTTKPQTRACSDKEVVIAQLVANSPAEGPAEDATKKSPSNSTGAGAAWGSGGGDIESAQPLITRLDEGDVEPFSLCAHCLVDKCGAHHCNRCQSCVVDMNYHCLVTMNCVGVGNSRIHFLFMVLVFAVCALFLVLTLSVEHTVHCPDSKGMLWNLVAVQVCIFKENPALALTPPVLLCVLNYAANKIWMVVSSIALETTKLDLSRKRNRVTSMQYMSATEILKKVTNFCATGSYPISRRSLREVEAEEKRIAEEEAKRAAEIEAQKEKHQGRRVYREGSFDFGDNSAGKSNTLNPLTSVGNIDR